MTKALLIGVLAVWCVTRVVAEQMRSRPDFLSATPTYGPEDSWIVVTGGKS